MRGNGRIDSKAIVPHFKHKDECKGVLQPGQAIVLKRITCRLFMAIVASRRPFSSDVNEFL